MWRSLLLRQLARRRPYRLTAWQRLLATSDLFRLTSNEGPNAIAFFAALTLLVGIMAWMLTSIPSPGSQICALFLTVGPLTFWLVFFLGRWSGCALNADEVRQLDAWMGETPELSKRCAQWWPEHEVLRRRDWYRVAWTRRMLLKAGPRPVARSTPSSLAKLASLFTLPSVQSTRWSTESRAILDAMLVQHGHGYQQAQPALPSSVAGLQGLPQAVSPRPLKPCPWTWLSWLVMVREHYKDDKQASSLLVAASTLLVTLVSLGSLGTTSLLAYAIIVSVVWCAWHELCSSRAWGLSRIPPLLFYVTKLNEACQSQPLMAWLFAQRCQDASLVSQADVLDLLAMAERVARAQEQAAAAEELLGLQSNSLAALERKSHQEAQVLREMLPVAVGNPRRAARI